MVGLGQVGQLEINGEGLGDALRVADAEPRNNLARFRESGVAEVRRRALLQRMFTVVDEQPAQQLHRMQQVLPGLFDQNPAQQCAE